MGHGPKGKSSGRAVTGPTDSRARFPEGARRSVTRASPGASVSCSGGPLAGGVARGVGLPGGLTHDRVAGGLQGLAGAAAGDRLGGARAQRVGSAGSQDPEAAAKTIDYLSRYANRVAISNSRLLGIEGEEVLFRYKDYRDGNQRKTMRAAGSGRRILPPQPDLPYWVPTPCIASIWPRGSYLPGSKKTHRRPPKSHCQNPPLCITFSRMSLSGFDSTLTRDDKPYAAIVSGISL